MTFKAGDAVRTNDLARTEDIYRSGRTGVVTALGRRNIIWVLWKGNKRPQPINSCFLRHAPPGDAP